MRIGILTFWKTEDNYGQLLQCYATQSFLKSLGHEPFLIKATNGREYNPTLKQRLISKLRTAYRLMPYPGYMLKRGIKSALYTLKHCKLKPEVINRRFEYFRKDCLNCTEKEYTLEMLSTNPPKADAYMVGSDQIWNTKDGIYFLSWAPDNAIKASIAASFGACEATDDFCKLIEPWVKRFDLVTVREQRGMEICQKIGRKDAQLVPDPTLLLTKDDYEVIADNHRVPDEPYLFVYFLGTRTTINWKEIHDFAKNNGLKIVYVGSQGQEDKFKKEEPAIPEWLGLMANAQYVITNSFHGTVFAIQFMKKFMVYPITGIAAKMNDRLSTLLNPLGLGDRIYAGSLAGITDNIDYNEIHRALSDKASESKKLIAAIFE